MRNISIAAVSLWGHEDQMLMVAEEALELAHAVHKWRRAYKKYNRAGVNLTRVQETTEKLETRAHQRYLEKCEEAVQLEAMQLLFMIDQLQVMLPGCYDEILDDVLRDATKRIQERGGTIDDLARCPSLRRLRSRTRARTGPGDPLRHG